MSRESIHKKVGRHSRRPPVVLEYDVETGTAVEKKEIPFVIGVVAPLAGNAERGDTKYKDREFVKIDRENFDGVMASMKPGVRIRVDNTLAGDGSEIGVDLEFNSMADFEPAAIARQVEPLRRLLEKRRHLTELLARVHGSDALEEKLEELLQSEPLLEELRKALPPTGSGSAAADSLRDEEKADD